jgi:hypothetical protein
MSKDDKKIASGLKKAGVKGAHHHLFLCLGPECAPMKEGEKVWKYLKEEVGERGLDVMRTKAACVTVERCARILDEHLGQGRPVREWIAAENPLRPPCAG